MEHNTRTPYDLLDFGSGRKLERFASVVLDRPCPAADRLPKQHPGVWASAVAQFRGSRTGDGFWSPPPKQWLPAEWRFEHSGKAPLQLQLEPLPSGQIGAFPEQAANWDWIARQVGRANQRLGEGAATKVLNLFAYTGGSTLSAASAGAAVVHIDAAQSIVDRARGNAALSKLAESPIRWIVEDALKFCQRELKRGNQYDAVILDPPTYGHGPKGEVWKIHEHLLPLLELCGKLTATRRSFILVSCHSPGIGPAELGAYLAEGVFGSCSQPALTGELSLQSADGRLLPSGVFARWPA